MAVPTGTVTFLFTDIEGSTRLWERSPEATAEALADHERILRQAFGAHGGHVFATGGDGFAVAFARAGDAVAAAEQAAQGLAEHDWPEGAPLKVRMGLHTGEVIERQGDYFGAAVNRAARLMAIAHGGQIVSSQATASMLGPEAILTPLGQHRLRDLGAPETVFQVGGGTFPPLRSLESHPTNLPVQLTSFVGRHREMTSVTKALESARLVTLTGVGGVGKTRLALQVAAHSLDQLPDGAWLVDLGALADPGALGEVAAASLGVTVAGGQSPTDALLGALSARELLLVVDNCEHLLDAVAALTDRILRAAPGVRLLATSREALGVPGEQIVPVPALGTGAAGEEEGGDALRLIVERAMAVRPDFTLSEGNRAALVEICRRLDGIPLAIELAAARLRAMTPEELSARLDQRFRLLTGGSRLAVNRHQTLRATIDWSYDLLGDDEREVLKKVSVFAGGFDLSGAEAFCPEADGDILELLTRLSDKSLLLADYLEARTRYRMLETVRAYALERLGAEGRLDEVRHAHASHYAGFSREAGAGLCGAHGRAWLEEIVREMENLRSAVIWAVEAGERDLAVRLIVPLAYEILPIEGAVAGWGELCLSLDGIEQEPLYPRLAAFVAYHRASWGRFDEARDLLARALQALEAGVNDDPELRVRVLASQSISGLFLGGPEEAHRISAERLAVARRSKSEWELARALGWHALAEFRLGRDGREPGTEGVEVARRTANTLLVCSSLYALAIATAPFDGPRALLLLGEAEHFALDSRSEVLLAAIRAQQAEILYSRGAGDLATAAEAAMAIVELEWKEIHRLVRGAAILRLLAACLAAAGDLDELAAVLEGFWRGTNADQHFGWMHTLNWNVYEDSLTTLRERLGEARWDELTQSGARLSDGEAVDLARRAVSELWARSDSRRT